MYRTSGKRIFDLIIACAASLIFFPVVVVVFMLLLGHHKGNPFFFQQRPGFREKIFTMVKFKTMRDRTDQHNNPLPDDQRLTALGKVIRKTSLDELPQLWNVLKGDMSIVGPRPLLIEYLPLYNPDHRKRHEVRPGITGWAQTHGRNSISWEHKFDLDLWYIKHLSLSLDVKILLLTIGQVVSLKDINVENPVVSEKFQG